ncbi:MAG TPA: hypothetical protein VK992_04730, partial [Candidatus Caenarcaniphilales bacterium]|nr:hypothetical protein [Candidatus Caenarcaniphilales bacterium]
MSQMAATLRWQRQTPFWRHAVFVGLAGGVVAIYLSLVGIVPTFDQRPLVSGVVSLGQAFILGTMILSGYVAARGARARPLQSVLAGALAGLLTGVVLSLMIIVARAADLRSMFVHASDRLYDVLTLGQGADSFWIPAVGGLLLGALAGTIAVLPPVLQRSIAAGAVSLTALGLFAGLLRTPLLNSPFASVGRLMFASEGVTLFGAAVALAGSLGAGVGAAIGGRLGGRRGGLIGGVLGGTAGALVGGVLGNDAATTIGLARPQAAAVGAVLGGALGVAGGALVGGYAARQANRAQLNERYGALAETPRRMLLLPVLVAGLLLVAALPHGFGQFFAQVVALVAIYILMGLGLNITLGLAGLLDLGFVAFFAVGAYTVGLLTSTGPLGIADLPYWAAVPFA